MGAYAARRLLTVPVLAGIVVITFLLTRLTPTWGGMIGDGRKYISQSWAVSLAPGIAIAAVILAFNI